MTDSPIHNWNLRIPCDRWDSASSLQVQVTSITLAASATDNGQGALPALLPSHYQSWLALSRNSIPLTPLPRPGADVLGLLDSLRCGGFLLDFRGRVLSLNTIARGCLGDGLVLRGKHLRATNSATDLRLQHMVGCPIGRMADYNVPMSVAVQRRSLLPLVIRPIRLHEGADRMPSSASLLLLACDPELKRQPPREMLMQAFGLTPVEADVAIRIASCKTLTEIAADRGIKIGTVRVLSKRVFSKTYTHGQAELTGLLTRLAFLVPTTEGNIVATARLKQGKA